VRLRTNVSFKYVHHGIGHKCYRNAVYHFVVFVQTFVCCTIFDISVLYGGSDSHLNVIFCVHYEFSTLEETVITLYGPIRVRRLYK
jgi:hypothetical protein